MTSHDIALENYIKLLYKHHSSMHLSDHQSNKIRLLIHDNNYTLARVNRIISIDEQTFDKTSKNFKSAFYEFLSLNLIRRIDNSLTNQEKEKWILSDEKPNIFFNIFPDLRVYQNIMIKFRSEFSYIFKGITCVDCLFRLYQLDKNILSEYNSFSRLYLSRFLISSDKSGSLDQIGIINNIIKNHMACRNVDYMENLPKNDKEYSIDAIGVHGNNEKHAKPHMFQEAKFDQSNCQCFYDNKDIVHRIQEPVPNQKHFNLNKMQRICLRSIEQNIENILLCAPTSSGKTGVAILSIIKCLESNYKNKIFFIAPIKALIRQHVVEINNILNMHTFSNARKILSIIEVSGDSHLSISEIKNASICVGTQEKLDILLRSGLKYDLIIIDEIHLLNSDRGDVIEAIVSRFTGRILAMSATISNFEDIRLFIQAPKYNSFYFDETFRPNKIKYEYNFIKFSNENEVNASIRALKEQGPVLFFVNTRKKTLEIAQRIVDEIKVSGGIKKSIIIPTEYNKAGCIENKIPGIDTEDLEITKLISHIKDYTLFNLIANGVCIHHAGLSKSVRLTIENLFRKKVINILICTMTLAWGINMPCHTVIIYGSFSSLEIIQMCGRAGRGSEVMDHDGPCAMGIYYGPHADNIDRMESHLLRKIGFHLNAEISMGSVRCLGDALRWFKKTFCFQRIQSVIRDFILGFGREPLEYSEKNKEFLRMFGATKAKDARESGYSERIVSSVSEIIAKYIIFDTIKDLNAFNLIKNFTPAILGSCSYKYYINTSEIVSFVELNKFYNKSLVLDLICSVITAPDVNLPGIDVPFPTNTKLGKIIQFILGGYDFQVDASSFLNNVSRVLSGLYEYAIIQKFAVAYKILYLFNMIESKNQELLKEEIGDSIPDNKYKANDTLKKSKHFCMRKYSDNFFYNDKVDSSFDDIYMNMSFYRSNKIIYGALIIKYDNCLDNNDLDLIITNSLDLDIIFCIRNLKRYPRQIYLENISDRFLHVRIISSSVPNTLYQQVLVKELPIFTDFPLKNLYKTQNKIFLKKDDKILSSSLNFSKWCKTYEVAPKCIGRNTIQYLHFSEYCQGYCNVLKQQFDYIIVPSYLDKRHDYFNEITYEEFNEIIWTEYFVGNGYMCDKELVIKPISTVLESGKMVIKSFKYDFKNKKGLIKVLLTDIHFTNEIYLIKTVINRCSTLGFDTMLVGESLHRLEHSVLFHVFFNRSNITVDITHELIGNLHRDTSATQIILFDTEESAKSCFKIFKKQKMYGSDAILTDDLSNRAKIIFTSNFNVCQKYDYVHLLFSNPTCMDIIRLSKYSKFVIVYTDEFMFRSLSTQIKTQLPDTDQQDLTCYDDNLNEDVCGTNPYKNVCGSNTEYNTKNHDDIKCKDNLKTHYLKLCDSSYHESIDKIDGMLCRVVIAHPPKVEILVYLGYEIGVNHSYKKIIMKYSLKINHLEWIMSKIKDGTSIRNIFKVLIGMYTDMHPMINIHEEHLIDSIIENSELIEKKGSEGNIYSVEQLIINDKKLKINPHQLKSIFSFLRKYLLCVMEICEIKRQFKAITVAIYAIQKLHGISNDFYSLKRCLKNKNSLEKAQDADELVDVSKTHSLNEKTPENKHNADEFIVASLSEYVDASFQKKSFDKKSLENIKLSKNGDDFGKVQLKIKKLVNDELTFVFIDEFYNFRIVHFYSTGLYLINWDNPVYVACVFGKEIRHL